VVQSRPAARLVEGLGETTMIKRLGVSLVLVGAAIFASAPPAAAQQTVNFTLGYFTLRGEDARVDGDVLRANLLASPCGPGNVEDCRLDYNLSDFNGATLGAEWLVAIGNHVEAGAGIGFYRRTVPSVYLDLVHPGGGDIEQDLRLRVVPISFSARLLPLGQDNGIQPYVGAGLGVFNWRYSEVGDFVDGTTLEIFSERFVATGNTTGPLVMGGIRFAGDSFTAGFEARYQRADAELPTGFVGDRLDLGGMTYLFTIGARFGR
jgi:hypothetical protein